MQNVIRVVLLLFCLPGVNTLYGQVCIYNTSPSNPISLTNVTNDTIKNLTISNPNGRGIALYYCKNVVIENCAINSTLGEGIYLYDCENVTVKNCSFSNNRAGVVALLGSAIKVLNNQFLNPGDYGNQIKGQFVQFDKVTGAGNKINDNVGESILGESYPEDLVSIYQSFGTINSPIEVKGNRFRGGGPSASGGGIMTGDLGGGNILVEDNILVNPGQYGIAIASGVNIKVINNQVYSKRQPFSNVGIYVWNQSQNSCENHEVWGNLVNYLDSNGNSNSHWDGGNCGSIVGWGANFWNANIDSTILPVELLCPDHSGLLAHYKFNGNLLDDSGNNNHGVNNGGSLFGGGAGQAASFDGGSKITIASNQSIKPQKSITISVWLKSEHEQGTEGVIRSCDSDGWYSGWRVTTTKNLIGARLSTTNGSKGLNCGNWPSDEWCHFVMTYDGSRLRGYVNGQLRSNSQMTGDIVYNGFSDMQIGYSNGTALFKGYLDELKIYSTSLSSADILQMYETDKESFENGVANQLGVLVNYKFDNNFSDASVHGNNATGASAFFSSSGQGKSVILNGSNTMISTPSASQIKPKKDFSVSLWLKPYQAGATKGIVTSCDADGWFDGWRITTSGQNLGARLVTTQAGKSLNCGKLNMNGWNHIVITYDGISLKGYLNGIRKDSALLSGDVIYNGNNDMIFGSYNGRSFIYAQLDEFVIYDAVLSNAQVAERYNVELTNISEVAKKTSELIKPLEDDKENRKVFQVFPNPFISSLELELFHHIDGFLDVTIYSLKGERVCNLLSGYYSQGSYYLSHNDLELPTGVYFIVCNSDGKIEKQKIQKKNY